MEYYDDIKYNAYSLVEDNFQIGEYQNCEFENCDLGCLDLSRFKFIDCTFKECNLSMAKINHTLIRDCNFIGSKMLGLRFDSCEPIGLSFKFENCQLSHSVFHKTKIKKTYFKDCVLHDVDFVDCDLSNSVFENCDLSRSLFENSNLEYVDFSSALGYSFDLNNNKVKKSKYSYPAIKGLLNQYNIVIE
jgi:fluoroquinolone resistance protein